MELLFSLSSLLMLMVVSVYRLNPYLKILLGAGLVVAFSLYGPIMIETPIYIAQCIFLIIFVTCAFIKKFREPIVDFIFLVVPSLMILDSTNITHTFFIINLIVFALYFHSQGNIDRRLLKPIYFFSAALDYFFIALVNARYFNDSSEITFTEVEYYLKASDSLYLLALPILSLCLKTLTPLFCLKIEIRSQYYRFYIIQSFFLLSPFIQSQGLFIEGLTSNYFSLCLVIVLLVMTVFFVQTKKTERLLLLGLFGVLISVLVFDGNELIVLAFIVGYLIHGVVQATLSKIHREVFDLLFGLFLITIYIHLAIMSKYLVFFFVSMAIIQSFYTLSPLLVANREKELV